MADDRSLGEAFRRLDDHKERLDGKVDAKVYEADQKADDARYARTEKDIERFRTFFWALLGALITSAAIDIWREMSGRG